MGLCCAFKLKNIISSQKFVKLLLNSCYSYNIFETRRWAIMGRKTGGGETGVLRHLKYRDKIDGKLPVPGSIEILTVGNGSSGSPRGLIVHTPYFNYVFNCGEGMQRVASEHKMKLSRIEHVFVTHNSWENVGGLMGLCLTMETSGVPNMVLHGPPNAEMLVTSARTFAQLRTLQLVKREVTDGDFEDSAMKMECIPIYPTCDEELPAKKPRLSGDFKDKDMSVVYACKPHPKPRTVSLEMCAEKNVPAGPHLALLKEGQEVTLADGRLVKPDDVLMPEEPSSPFLVVDCPTEAYLENLISNVDIAKYQTSSCVRQMASLVIHFTPASIFKSSVYQEWMKKFDPETVHLVLNEMGSGIATEAVYCIQAKLNMLHPQIFPLLPHQSELLESTALEPNETKEKVVYGRTNLRYIYRGRDANTFSWKDCVRINNDAYAKEVLNDEEFTKHLHSIQQSILHNTDNTNPSSNYPEIIFLGTGSAVPNKVRNVSAVWINMTENSSMLLDCGEDTSGQLFRHYGNKTPELLQRLKAVFVSHLHADHHLGIVGLALKRRQQLLNTQSSFDPLTVIAPAGIRGWYETLHSAPVPIMDLVRVVPLEHLYPSNQEKYGSMYDEVLSYLELKEIKPVRVLHRQFPHGLVLTHKNGWKLTYSGDTMPCTELIEAGRDSDVLIHEATMEDFLVDDAKDKRHSTTSQAIDVGIKMDAKFILLTHFSQRYAKVPVFNDSFSSKVGIAFDNMKVRLSDLHLLPLFAPALKAMFAEDYMEMEEKTEKKKRQKDRKENLEAAAKVSASATSSMK